jgi:hypothetical protein
MKSESQRCGMTRHGTTVVQRQYGRHKPSDCERKAHTFIREKKGKSDSEQNDQKIKLDKAYESILEQEVPYQSDKDSKSKTSNVKIGTIMWKWLNNKWLDNKGK